MGSLAAYGAVAGTGIAGTVGLILLKHFTVTDRVEHLILAFAAYAISNVMMISVLAQSGVARGIILVTAAQIVIAATVGWGFHREQFTLTGLLSLIFCVFAAVLASLPATDS